MFGSRHVKHEICWVKDMLPASHKLFIPLTTAQSHQDVRCEEPGSDFLFLLGIMMMSGRRLSLSWGGEGIQ